MDLKRMSRFIERSDRAGKVQIAGIKLRCCVDLDRLEASMQEIDSEGRFGKPLVTRYPAFDLVVCDYGGFELLGCGASVDADLRRVTLVVQVRGLAALAHALAHSQEAVMVGSNLTLDGTSLRLCLRDGLVVECVEAA
ncbi:MAG: hypothetical protein KGI35_05045 [Burkholderiales bacterium]|nr:hypothetical protein [Burkholderiales bacterium]MDE2396651.1 hypothetical protein [Burkholderiales bacterium]